MDLIALGYNGTSLATSSGGRIKAVVDNSYVANGANIPVGWQITVNDTVSGTTNTQKLHNFYANGNVVFANTVFATDNLFASGNITSNIGTFIGNGAGLTNLPAGNLTGNVANWNIVSSTVSLPTTQFNTTGIIVGTTANANLEANSLVVIADYGNGQGDGNSALTKSTSYVKLRGDSGAPTTAVANDIIKRENYLAYNATSNVLYSSVTANATTINANANAVWGSGSYQINTGGVNGDLGNANALSAYNSFNFLSTGQLQMIPGANSAPGSLLQIVSYGQPTSVSQSQGITFSKARGNRDANASVQANDTLGRLVFQGHNGNAFVTNRLPIIRSTVDSTYTTGNANIPAGFQILTCDSNTNYLHNFYANGAVAIGGNLSANGGQFALSNSAGGRSSFTVFGDKTPNSAFDLSDAQFSVTMSNVNTTTGFSPFRFQQYAPTSSEFGSIFFYRARGNSFANSAPVVANDQVMSLNFIVNSNNTTASIGSFNSVVTSNDNAGNIGMKYELNAGTGTTGYLDSSIVLNANTTTANNFSANNVSLSRFQETVYGIGSTSGTITPDFINGSIQTMTLTGNITMNSLGNAVAGRSMTLIVTQDGTGGRTLTSSMLFAGGIKTLSTAGGAKDIISVFYDGSTYFASLTKGYA